MAPTWDDPVLFPTRETAKTLSFWRITPYQVILLGAFWILNISQVRSKKNFTFSNEFFGRCAQTFVRYLSETLPTARRSNPEPLSFLIGVNFWKISKVVTWLSKIKKIRKFWHLFCKLQELHRTFFPKLCLNTFLFQRSVKWTFYITKLSLFEQKFVLICRKTCFLVVCWILGCFSIQFQKHFYWIPGLVIT